MSLYIDEIPTACFTGSRIGLEKEGLRVLKDGQLTTSQHPEAFGSALTHQSITTDFSESQLELVTPPCWSCHNAINNLTNLQTFVHKQLHNDELIWTASMPGVLGDEDNIRIADYGSSDSGMMKTVYRRGLSHRYGKKMQLISGIHFNYSFSNEIWPVLQELSKADSKQSLSPSEFTSERYMSTIRNIQRYDWLLLYLFGASPAVSKTFFSTANGADNDTENKLQAFDKDTLYNPYATSLRMSDVGYTNRNRKQEQTFISHESLSAYIRTLSQATNTPNLDYQRIGCYNENGERQQLNTHELQIENEYYTSVRPKQIPHTGETSLEALQKRGIRYLELRSIDISPFTSTGLDQQQLHFLELFVNYCLLKENKTDDQQSTEIKNAEINRSNLNLTAFYGRDPSLKLIKNNNKIKLQDWADQLFNEMAPIAEKLDTTHRNNIYSKALRNYRKLLSNPELTPSARILEEMRSHNESYADFVLRKSQEHHQYHLTIKMEEECHEFYKALSRQSIRQLESLEQNMEKEAQFYT